MAYIIKFNQLHNQSLNLDHQHQFILMFYLHELNLLFMVIVYQLQQ